MSKPETRALIRSFIEEENRGQLFYFRAFGSEKRGHYADMQKVYAINKAMSLGVRATSHLLNVPRRTIQRWLRANGITVKRCPDLVYDWTYWRRRRIEKRTFWRYMWPLKKLKNYTFCNFIAISSNLI